MSSAVFPDGFLWGASTSAYQIEGGVNEGGRGPSIWDAFCRTPGRVRDGDTGDVAADHYHRWVDDVELMREVGLKAYRFSVAWPRVQPSGDGEPNQQGLDFYRRLADALLSAGITPLPTLYHWDLPQPLQDEGGWPNRSTAHRFADYASTVVDALGDRVDRWLTINEPWCAAFLGYGTGWHAPGIRDHQQAVAAAHHLLLAHGLAADSMKGTRSDLTVGIALNLAPVRAATSSAGDADAARRLDGVLNRLFLDPLLRGSYPDDVMADFAQSIDLSHQRPGDLDAIASRTDLLGVNYYHRFVVAGASDSAASSEAFGWPGGERIAVVPQGLPRTAMGWEVDATGLSDLLLELRRYYPPIPIMVTENGAAYDDHPTADGRVHDPHRIEYLQRHILAAHRAIEDGVDLRGYFVWSLLDNFEWAEGYSKRFGLTYVDYASQRRTPKDSSLWYRHVIDQNGIAEA
jgi:beta-glucosidase